MTAPSVVYRIDADDRLVAVNSGWTDFARANGAGAALFPPNIIGGRLWDYIADATTVHIYRQLCAQLRRGSAPAQFHFRCDGPDTRRLLSMTMRAVEQHHVEFEVVSVEEQVRPPVPLLAMQLDQTGDVLVPMCGWCKSVQLRPGEWTELEKAIEPLNLFPRTGQVPAITHGICGACEDQMIAQLEKLQS